MKILRKYFWGVIAKLDYILGSFLCTLWSFLNFKEQNRNIFGVVKIKNIVLGTCMPAISDIFGVNSRQWVRAYVLRKK